MSQTGVESRLDNLIADHDLDAFLQYDDASNTNQRYVSRFVAHDPFIFLRQGGQSVLVTPPLEKGRAEDESSVDTVRSTAEFVAGDVRGALDAEIDVLVKCLADYEITRVGVPRDFPLYLAEQLTNEGLHVESVTDVIVEARKQKQPDEIQALSTAQSATKRAMSKAERIIRESTIRDETLYFEGEKLTSERLRTQLQTVLLDEGCTLEEAIVTCGPPGADPHHLGAEELRANEPILLDIYPEHESGYWGDMTRTFVKGTASQELQAMYETTKDAFDTALDVLSAGAGVTGGEVHEAVCDVFEEAGYLTLRDGDIDDGFLHSTGHAIGLDLHEPPRLVTDAGELEAGYALTIEPGLYDRDIGAARIEDMIVVTEDGYRNLNSYHTELVL
jgi:Xaa-Pro aminopeptidase